MSYETAWKAHSTAQGLDPITEHLDRHGITYEVQQTGGWVMVVTIPVPTGIFVMTNEDPTEPDHLLMGWYPGASWDSPDQADADWYEPRVDLDEMVRTIRREQDR